MATSCVGIYTTACTTAPLRLTALQMGSFFVEQGELMDRYLGRGLQIPAASLSIFNTLSIVVLIPLYDRGLVPLLKRCGVRISELARIGGAPHQRTA